MSTATDIFYSALRTAEAIDASIDWETAVPAEEAGRAGAAWEAVDAARTAMQTEGLVALTRITEECGGYDKAISGV